jgi:hypothetical protein
MVHPFPKLVLFPFRNHGFRNLKKAGTLDVELMCTMQLMVAAFNMNNEVTRWGARAELLNLIPPPINAPERKGDKSWLCWVKGKVLLKMACG